MTYPVIVERSATGFAVNAPQFRAYALAETKDEALHKVSVLIARQLFNGYVPQPATHADLDTSFYDDFEIVDVEPAVLNPVSLQLEQLILESGLSQAEAARRMGTSPSGLNRLLDPLYFGHKLETLERAASALGKKLELSFT